MPESLRLLASVKCRLKEPTECSVEARFQDKRLLAVGRGAPLNKVLEVLEEVLEILQAADRPAETHEIEFPCLAR
jgi:hypothetical protein